MLIFSSSFIVILSSHPTGHDRQELIYELKAVLIHRGPSANSGHYVAHIFDQVAGDWYKFNDEEVQQIKGKTLKLGLEEDPLGRCHHKSIDMVHRRVGRCHHKSIGMVRRSLGRCHRKSIDMVLRSLGRYHRKRIAMVHRPIGRCHCTSIAMVHRSLGRSHLKSIDMVHRPLGRCHRMKALIWCVCRWVGVIVKA